jgi:N-methylhydantoinase A
MPSPRRLLSPGKRASGPLEVAIDTGGTFTDAVWVQQGRVRILKVLSTPSDPSRAIVQALRQILAENGGRPLAFRLLHGTTVGTNAVLERKGARVAFVTTGGFEDSIEIGRQARPRLYDLFFDRVVPLVPQGLRFGVAERTGPDGVILLRPSAAELDALCRNISRQPVEAVAVSFLFSFAQPDNERRTAQVLKRLGLPISLSHQILPEFREYERASTVVMNAYLQPVMSRYLGALQEGLEALLSGEGKARRRASARKTGARIYVMQSSGGITSLEAAQQEPVRTVLSGPAGGVVGALASARRSGLDRIIAFDMGGTSTDVTLVESEPKAGTEGEIAGLPVGVPMLDIHTIGAGGGSLARLDAAGALRVGPESAGADPGPICYGRGTQPTVTDANLLLGRLPADAFLGGEFRLDRNRTARLVEEWLWQQRARMSVTEFAAGVVRVVNAAMEKAIRVVSIERGYDPREFALVAFGGAGGMHACELAAALEIPRVIVPALPGALSAFGILVSDIVKDYSRTLLLRVGGSESSLPGGMARRLRQELAELTRTARRDFRTEHQQPPDTFAPSLDIRYRGQGFELNVPWAADFLEKFHEQHRRRYGYSHPEREVEVVTLRLRARLVSASNPGQGKTPAPSAKKKPVPSSVNFAGALHKTLVYQREALPTGKKFDGPAIVAEYSATTAVPPGWKFCRDAAQNLLIESSGR